MGSRDSWIDRAEVSELAGKIFPQTRLPHVSAEVYVPLPLLEDDDLSATGEMVADAGADDDMEGKVARIGERLRSIRERAERSGLLVGGEKVGQVSGVDEGEVRSDGVPEPFLLHPGKLVEQVEALVGWMAGAAEQVFVLDELGDELVSGEVPAGLRSGAVRLAQSWERSQRWLREDGQAVDAPVAGAALAGGKVMSVVGVRCASGFYCAALVRERMICASHAARVRDALILVFS